MFKRILMNQVDASPGNSAPAAPPASDAPAQAQGATVTLTQADLDAKIAAAVDLGFAKARDSFHAEARRASEAANKPKPTTKTDSAATPAGPDPIRLRSLDRALNKAGLASKLTDSQYQRAEKAFASEDPSDVDAWVTDYFAGFGVQQPATPAAQVAAPQAPAAPKPQNDRPASDRGAPPPSQVPLVEADLMTMSETDRAALLKEKGPVWYRNQLAKQLRGRPISIR